MLDMIQCTSGGAYYARGEWVPADENAGQVLASKGFDAAAAAQAKKGTMAYGILSAHNHSGDDDALQLKFDAMASHDITFVGIIQTARASGLERFPIPYVLTNCHNSLCAVGGTINEDDHRFGLSAAQKYGGIFVPPHLAVIHQYMREQFAGCGKMILGSDSHTRYGALGTMAIGEGGGELAKQLVGRTYDFARPQVDSIYGMKEGESPWLLAALLLLLIGPAEEIFWRGYVQRTLSKRWNPNAGFVVATLIYALVHAGSCNFMLVMAALVVGAAWGALYRFFPNRFAAIILSHAVWDVAVFIFFPI